MKELEKGELITLEDQVEYLVLDRINCGFTTYLYLLLAGDKLSFHIAKEEVQNNDIYLTMVNDPEEERYVIDRYQRINKNHQEV